MKGGDSSLGPRVASLFLHLANMGPAGQSLWMKPQTLSSFLSPSLTLSPAGRLLLFQARMLQPHWAPGVAEAGYPRAWPQKPVIGI